MIAIASLQEDGEKRAAEEEKKRKAKCNYIRRVIAHPCFHNYTFKDAEKELMEMEQGEVGWEGGTDEHVEGRWTSARWVGKGEEDYNKDVKRKRRKGE